VDLSALSPRLLLGPGPSPVSPRILEALSRPTLGHLDPQFLAVLDDVSEGLRRLFGTENPTTFPVSGTGSAGMEASMVNLLEPGDTAIVGINGVFGTRLAEMARRMGARVVQVEVEWGRVLDTERLVQAHRDHPDARLLAVVHAETSTGARQPLEELGAYLRDTDTLLVVDAVTSLGGIPVEVDAWGIDVCYSGTQKCLGVPPGLAPITFSPRAVERIRTRKSPVASWYLDVTLISGYLGSERRYHHTAPINLIFALHEALTEVEEEGHDARFRRHAAVGARLQSELAERGFRSFTDEDNRLPQLTAVHLPGDRDEGPPRAALLADHGIEVGGGLGPAKGKIWRIGLMGHGARDESVDRLLGAMDEVLGAA
jgi:alanine-glyoxylate transaminase / serine-glyoxylate transaminase / serine-pyruvate transaminase